jgi:hypothetical protein
MRESGKIQLQEDTFWVGIKQFLAKLDVATLIDWI